MLHKFFRIIFFINIFSVNVLPQGSWSGINSPTNEFLKSVFFADSLYGWVAGSSGTIIHTTNGGSDWILQDSKMNYGIEDVFFLNRNLGWAVAWKLDAPPFGTVILKTTDGGNNWTNSFYREDNIFMHSIIFLDSLNGWMGGEPHALVNSTDGGTNWQQADIDSLTFAFFPVLNIQFDKDNPDYGYACGGRFDIAGVTWRTYNGGSNWTPMDIVYAPADPVNQLYIFDSLNVIGIGGDPEFFGVFVMRTSDGGVTWDYNELGIQGVAFDLDFRTSYEAWSPLGPERGFVFTVDSGQTWSYIDTPDSAAVYDVDFPDSLHGFAVGENGMILKYTPPIIDNIIEVNETYPNELKLYQNYPNPFNPSTKIKFVIPYDGERNAVNVKLIVYDALGKEVVVLIDDALPTGEYSVEFNAGNLPSGIYFNRLQAGAKVITKKMLLLK